MSHHLEVARQTVSHTAGLGFALFIFARNQFYPWYGDVTIEHNAQVAMQCRLSRGQRCSSRGGSRGMYITVTSAKANKAEPTLTLKPSGDITRNKTVGTRIGHVYVSAKNIFKEREDNAQCLNDPLLPE